MTQNEFDLFLSGAIGICAILALVNLARLRSRGLSAIFLTIALLLMGLFVYGLKEAWDQTMLIGVAVVMGIFIVLDVLYRSKLHAEKVDK